MNYIAYIILFFLIMLFVLFMCLKSIIVDKKVRNNVTNSDPFTQHYCFVLNCNQQEAVEQLSNRNVKDKLEYTFDTNSLIITFLHLGVSIDHQLSFYTIENRTYLKVSKMKFLHSQSKIPLMINSFFVNKIGAVPVDYTYFEALVCFTN